MGDNPQSTDRRSRERARKTRRQRRWNTVGTVLTLAVLAVVVLISTDTFRIGSKGPSLASGKTKVPTVTTEDAGNQIVKLKRQSPVRPLSHAAPLRLWVGGDSLAGDLGYQLGPMLSKTGIVQAHVDYKISSGLASNNVRNWPENFTQENTQYSPEATVFMVGANDAPIVGSAVDASGTPEWETKYRAKVDNMMDLLVGGAAQRTVFWIGSPPLDTRYDHGASEVDRVMQEEAAKWPTVVYIDAYKLFSVDGGFSAYLTDANGDRVRMRTSDGVHLTVAGGEFLAQHVYQLIDKRWNLASQAAPEEPIDYTIEPKSGTIGGVHLRNQHPASTTTAPTQTTAATTTTKPTSTTVAPTTTTRKHGPTTSTPAPPTS